MSVLIKGMKMPQDGRRHKALVIFEPDGTCKIVCEYSESYSERHIKTFEAIELPPNGRLIDADALMETFRERKRPTLSNGEDGSKERVRYLDFISTLQAIKDAPTIIETEEE